MTSDDEETTEVIDRLSGTCFLPADQLLSYSAHVHAVNKGCMVYIFFDVSRSALMKKKAAKTAGVLIRVLRSLHVNEEEISQQSVNVWM